MLTIFPGSQFTGQGGYMDMVSNKVKNNVAIMRHCFLFYWLMMNQFIKF